MSRCPDCGMKECCGSYMSEDIERQRAEINAYKQDLERTIAEKVDMQTKIDSLKEYIFDLQAEVVGHKGE